MKPQGRPGPRRTLWNPENLPEPYRKPPPPRSRRWNLTLDHPAALAECGGTLKQIEPWWKCGGPWWNPGGTLVELSWNLTSNHPGPPRSPRRTLRNPGDGTLVEPWWNSRGTLPQTTPDHPAALADWWNPGGTLVEPWWNPGGTLVQPSWNLTSGPPRTSPEPIWAETPKLSAVGEKRKKKNGKRKKKKKKKKKEAARSAGSPGASPRAPAAVGSAAPPRPPAGPRPPHAPPGAAASSSRIGPGAPHKKKDDKSGSSGTHRETRVVLASIRLWVKNELACLTSHPDWGEKRRRAYQHPAKVPKV